MEKYRVSFYDNGKRVEKNIEADKVTESEATFAFWQGDKLLITVPKIVSSQVYHNGTRMFPRLWRPARVV